MTTTKTQTQTQTTADAVTDPAAGATTADRIAGARRRIDALDARIVALIKERMSASDEIQQIRITDGGRRVDLAREMDILRTYGDALGRERGTRLAMTLLELCRGTGR
ncbi:chorismate mutase [Streptomyces sp. NPDC059853]|uniref:chorismate mutase n=1 Tax=Streptomyces sp. NPDC059853 TaxID=3346973 RepID=UPI0036663E3C